MFGLVLTNSCFYVKVLKRQIWSSFCGGGRGRLSCRAGYFSVHNNHMKRMMLRYIQLMEIHFEITKNVTEHTRLQNFHLQNH